MLETIAHLTPVKYGVDAIYTKSLLPWMGILEFPIDTMERERLAYNRIRAHPE